MKSKTKSMLYISLGATFIALSSWITLPFPIPFTMQTFAIFFLLKVFGGRIGGLSVLFHISMGLIGLPVFSGFRGGVSELVSPTGGYIIGFAVTGALYFALYSLLNKKRTLDMLFPYICLTLCYGVGTAWYMNYISAEGEIGLVSALSVCVLPYIVPDVIKIFLATLVAKKLKRHIKG